MLFGFHDLCLIANSFRRIWFGYYNVDSTYMTKLSGGITFLLVKINQYHYELVTMFILFLHIAYILL